MTFPCKPDSFELEVGRFLGLPQRIGDVLFGEPALLHRCSWLPPGRSEATVSLVLTCEAFPGNVTGSPASAVPWYGWRNAGQSAPISGRMRQPRPRTSKPNRHKRGGRPMTNLPRPLKSRSRRGRAIVSDAHITDQIVRVCHS